MFSLPRIGQGMGQYKWPDNQEHLLRQGIDLGMNFIDTAENYGGGLSEKIVGQAISGQRSKVIVGTKFSPENARHKDILRSAENSLHRLKTDYIDIYQMHWPNPDVLVEESIEAFSKLLESGKIRFVGTSNYSLKDLRALHSTIGVSACQMEYNLFDRYIEGKILPFCLSNGIRIIAYSPLDRGRISLNRHRGIVDKISHKYDKLPSQIALAWITRNHTTAIPTARNLNHIIMNAGSQFNLEQSDIDILDGLDQKIIYVKPSAICVSLEGEDNKVVYQTLEDAKNNHLNFVPSPTQLARDMDDNIKPVRLMTARTTGYEYDLVEGRIRYWAWVISRGNDPIPAYIRDNF